LVLGRTKGTHIKRVAEELVSKYREAFSDDFEKNKAKIRSLGLASESKMERNKLAGEITVRICQLKRKEQSEE